MSLANRCTCRRRPILTRVALAIVLLALLPCAACSRGRPPTVVVYTSVDQPYSEPVLQAFEKQSGIRVQAVYDTEASKTTGLISRLLAEQSRPQADVFWSSEIAQTLWLQEQGIWAPYVSPVAADIPAAYRDAAGYWSGLGLRARIILVNTDLVPESDYPHSLYDLLDPRWAAGEVGLANPLFGTTATHAAALYAALGPAEARSFFLALRDQGARVLDGNSVVRDMVASGDLKVGLTDTDDADVAVRQGKPVVVIFPDQEELGTLLIPNTVALVAGGPNPEQGKALVDFLLSLEVEDMLLQERFFYASVRPGEKAPGRLAMQISWAEVARQMEQVKSEMREVFLQQ